MKSVNPLLALPVPLVVGLLAACRTGELVSEPAPGATQGAASELASPVDPAVIRGERALLVASANPERPRLRYPDGQLSGNESCFIKLGNKLNPKVPPLYINGNPVGFC